MFLALLQDIRVASRSLVRRPGFTLTAIVVLAIGIGTSTGIMSIAAAVLLQRLPYPDADRLVSMHEDNPGGGMEQVWTSYQNFLDWQQRAGSFEQMAAAYAPQSLVASGPEPETLTATIATPGYFALTGAEPVIGRLFAEAEHRTPGAHAVAVISEDYWTRRFGRAHGTVGGSLVLNGRPYTIIGVLPAGFANFPNLSLHVDVWVPMMMAPEFLHPNVLEDRNIRTLAVLAKLHPGIGAQEARDELERLSATLAVENPITNKGWIARFTGVRELILGSFRVPLIALLVGAGFLLLIGCANVGNLVLLRAAESGRELALRLALGAGRARLLAYTLTEAMLLTLAGAALGVILSAWSLEAAVHFSPIQLPDFLVVEINGGVLAATLGLALVSGIVIGLAPLVAATRLDTHAILGGGGKGALAGGSRRLREAFVVTEVAIAVALLVGAGLVIRSLEQLQSTDIGFDPSSLLTVSVAVSTEVRNDDELSALATELSVSATSVPGISAASIWSPHVPGAAVWYTRIRAHDRPRLDDDELPLVRYHYVDGDAFPTLGLRMLRGRPIASTDRADTEPVVVLSESAAAAMWPDQNAIGKILRRWNRDAWATVIGVVEDAYQAGRQGPGGEILRDVYFVFDQEPQRTLVLLAKAEGDTDSRITDLRQAIQRTASDLPVFDIRPLASRLAEEERTPRFTAVLGSAFSTLALVLAAIGLYSVLAHAVSQQSREIGLRMALGAWPGTILRRVVARGLGLALAGAAIGLLTALLTTRWLGSILYQVNTTDPFALAVGPLLLILAVGLACLIPARRATRVDPINALRNE